MRKANVSGVTSLISPSSSASAVVINNDAKNAYIDFINIKALRADICVYDILGRTAWQQKNTNIASGKYTINGSNFTSGVYVVKVVVDGQVTTQKVVFEQ